MALGGNGVAIDFTFHAAVNLRTTTAQYMAVAMVPGTTTAVDFTVEGASNSATVGVATSTARFAIGINQTYMTANSDHCVVRLLGMSKVICAESITAGEWLKADVGVSATIVEGGVQAIDDGQTSSSGGYITATAHTVVLGRAFERGSTNTVITAFINPQMYEFSLMATST